MAENSSEDRIDPPDAPKPDEVPADQNPRIERFDFTEARRLSTSQVDALNKLQEALADDLTHSLGALLGMPVEVGILPFEQRLYSEFLEQLEAVNYLTAIQLGPADLQAVVQMAPALAFPVIDLLLGGKGKPGFAVREMTEIEVQVLETTVGVIVRDLERSFSTVLEFTASFEKSMTRDEALQLMPPDDRTLSLAFQLQTTETQGSFQIILPTLISSALLDQLSHKVSYQARHASTGPNERLTEHLMHTRFPVELVLADTPVPAEQLLGLEVGQILSLPHAIKKPALLRIGHRNMFTALPVRGRSTRGALVQEPIRTSGKNP